eukprot:COSAG02_NODE_24055_length_699_cov_1.053333_1_plen_70_part_01
MQQYAAAVAALEDGAAVWPEAELLLLTLYANSAACFLQMDLPLKAIEQCQMGEALPMACAELSLHGKLFA